MITTTRAQQSYDHRLKQLVRRAGKIDVALRNGIPRSTAYGWLTQAHADVVTLDVLEVDVADLQREVIQLRQHCIRLITLLRLMMTVVKVSGVSMSRVRLPDEQPRRRVRGAIQQAGMHFTLKTVLRVIGLTRGRYHACSTDQCGLDESDFCPKHCLSN